MRVLFFSMLIVTPHMYSASMMSEQKKHDELNWYDPDKKNLAVTWIIWDAKNHPNKQEGSMLLYTDTPLSPDFHDQNVAKLFFKLFQKEYLSSGPICSAATLITLCRTAIEQVNKALPFADTILHRVTRYILAVKTGDVTLLTKVDAADFHEVFPQLPEDEALENLPWERYREVRIYEPDYGIKIGCIPVLPHASFPDRCLDIYNPSIPCSYRPQQ